MGKQQMGKVKKVVFYILMFTLMCFFCFLVLKYGVERFYYSNVNRISYKVFDPLLGWRLKPGTYLIKPGHTFMKHRIYINRHGLRSRDIESNRENVTKRIVILGDSFTFAEVIREEHIFPVQLEKLLNKGCPEEYRVINAGIPGYGNAQELLLMQRLSEDGIVGNLYVLMVFTNDILDNLRLSYGNLLENPVQPGFILNNEGRLELRYLPCNTVPDHSDTFVPVEKTQQRLELFVVLRRQIESFIQTRPALLKALNRARFNVEFPRMPGLLNGWYRDSTLNTGVPLMKALIREIRNEAKRNKARLLVCLIPSPLQIYPDVYGPLLKKTFPNEPMVSTWLEYKTRPQHIVRKMCEELDIPFLDLHQVLYQNNRIALYFPREGHLSKAGHAIVAQSLAQYIKKEQKPLDKGIAWREEFELD